MSARTLDEIAFDYGDKVSRGCSPDAMCRRAAEEHAANVAAAIRAEERERAAGLVAAVKMGAHLEWDDPAIRDVFVRALAAYEAER